MTKKQKQDKALDELQDFEEHMKTYDESSICLSVSDTFMDGHFCGLIQHLDGDGPDTGESHCLYFSAKQLDTFIKKLTKLRDKLKEAGEP